MPANLSHTHDSLMNFMLANPAMKLGDIAAQFGYTQSWLSQLIHSNAFQARLREKQNEMFAASCLTLAEKMQAVASDALDIVHDHLLETRDAADALKAADTFLHRLGYAPQRTGPPAAVVNNTLVISQSDLAEARAAIQEAAVAPRRIEPPVGGDFHQPPALLAGQ